MALELWRPKLMARTPFRELARLEREARRIRVDVHDGTVTLTGDVHSWAERESVLAAARFTPGVRALEDHLRTQPV